MVDRYLWGNVNRISPEAPVPVVDVYQSENRPGGAANVALNLAALGCKVELAGAVGQDEEGKSLLAMLQKKGFGTDAILSLDSRVTTTKTRVIGNRQQMMRIDREDRDLLAPAEKQQMVDQVLALLDQVDVVIFEDYDKGVLEAGCIQTIIQACNTRNLPTVVDPKFNNFFGYSGCTVFKPNLKELNDGLKIQVDNNNMAGLLEAIALLKSKMPHLRTLITLSENGVLALDEEGNPTHHAAHYRKITDVSGAGDTVVAVMGCALGADIDLGTAAAIANLAGGLVCEEVGVVPIDRDRLFSEMSNR
ncbi:UNVERIFIED_CONTAM: hypothetical protein GTU68_031035 [Idotea baltica]|nr:hypothetical protein [Idotea baltica]